MSADSRGRLASNTSGDTLEAADEFFDSATSGWPVAKGSGLAQSLRLALEQPTQIGEDRTIATICGVEKA
ncbi:MAG: hypothetical protein ACJ8EL_14720 [Rhizomicrobium sp.]|jgi:hypothetical protein